MFQNKSRNFNEQINDIVYLIKFSHMMEGENRRIQQIRQQQSYFIKSRASSPIRIARRSSQQNLSQVQLPPLFKQQEQEAPIYDEQILERVRKLEIENDRLKKLIKPKKRKRQPNKSNNQKMDTQESQKNSKLNLPTHKDLINMEQQLKQLILTKLRLIVQICLRNRRNIIRFIKIIKELLKEKIQNFVKQFPKIQSNFEQQIKDKMNNKLKSILSNLGTKKFFEDKSKFFNETKRRVAETIDCLRSIYKILFSTDSEIYDENLFEFIKQVASDNITVLPFYLFKFELNRLTFTTLGGLRLSKGQSQLMLFTSLWIRIYLPIIFDFKLPNQFPQFDKNIHTIGSFIYNTLMDYLRSSYIQLRDNLKSVPYDYQPSLRSRNVIKFYRFQESENDKEKLVNLQIKDEPLLYPTLDKEEFMSLYEERIFIQSLYQQYEGWAEQVYQLLLKHKQKTKSNQKQDWQQKSNKLYQMINEIQPSIIKQQYTASISQMYNLKEEIRQTKNYLDIYQDSDTSK